MKMVYIAGKYRAPTVGGVKQNIQVARHYAEKYWKLGYAVICPHSNSSHMELNVPEHILMEGDFELIKRCDAIVAIPGWEESVGTRAELEFAGKHNIRIIWEVE